jgi:carotenoid cleavage dioxygenase-like enzyme
MKVSLRFSAAAAACYGNLFITAFAPQQNHQQRLFLHQASISQKEDVTTNVNFEEWISDAPDEVTYWKPCPIIDGGSIPAYVKGTLIRNGCGIWTTATPNNSNGNEEFSHIFDGFAKIHAYKISSSSRIECQSRFLLGSWYKTFLKRGKQSLPTGIGTGPILDSTTKQPKLGIIRTIKALFNSATIFDNTPVNIWDYQPHIKGSNDKKKTIAALTDAPPRTTIDLNTMNTIKSSTINPLASGARGYELLETAHPIYSHTGSDTYNVAVELGLQGSNINLVKETSQGDRFVVSSVPTDGIPYIHSFGLSANYAMIVLQPLRLDPTPNRLMELGFLRGMQHVNQTRVVVVKLRSGDVVLDKYIDEKVYFYHSISQAEMFDEERGDDSGVIVSLRLCAYKTPDQITGENQFMRLEQAKKGRQWRNKLHKGGKFCDINCNLLDKSVQVDWKDEISQGYELPVTRYSRAYGSECLSAKHPRYVYAFGAYALGSPDYDNWGLFKFDLEVSVTNV